MVCRLRSAGVVVLLAGLLSSCGQPPNAATRWLEGLPAVKPGTAQNLTPRNVTAPQDSAATALLAWHVLWVAQGGSGALSELVAAGERLATRMDPVWGGVLERPPEALGEGMAKSLHTQALALEAFANLYWASGEQRFANAFAQIDEYLQDWLRQRNGGYASGQLARPEALRAGLSAADYWGTRREHDRRSLGIPPVQGQADSHAQLALARAYLLAADAFADSSYLSAADALLQASEQTAEAACTTAPLRLGLRLRLLQQAGGALPEQRQRLRAAMDALLVQRLEHDHCEAAADLGAYSRVALAAALQQMVLETGDVGLNDAPAVLLQQALQDIQDAGLERQLPVLVAARALIAGPVVYLFEGSADDPRREFLQSLARAVWTPRKTLLHRAGLGSQPAVLRICSPGVCALPITAAADPAPTAQRVRTALRQIETAGTVAITAQVPALLGLAGLQDFPSSSTSGALP